MQKRKNLFLYFLLALVTIVWGLGFVFTKQVLPYVSPSLLNVLRFSVAALITFILFFKQVVKLNIKQCLSGVLAGTLIVFSFGCQTYSMVYTSATNTSLMTGLYVVMVPFFIWAAHKKRPPIRAFVAGFLGFASIACLAFGGLSKLNFGDLLAFFCAVGFAVHYLVLDKATKSTPAGALTFVQMLTAAVLFFVVGFIVDGKAMLNCSFPKSIILPLFTLCVLNTAFAYIVQTRDTAFAYIVQTRAQKTIDASKVSLVLSFESTLVAVFAVILGGDKFTWYLALSIIGMTAAILIAEWPQKKQTSSLPDIETNNYDFSAISSSDDQINLP